MRRVVRSLLLVFCTTLFMLSASVCVCVVRVHADNTYNGTYFVFTPNECYLNIVKSQGSYFSQHVTVESRAVILRNTYYLVCDQRFNLGSISGNQPTSNCSPYAYDVSRSTYYNGHTYYISNLNYVDVSYNPYNVPVINATEDFNTAVYYTYGDGAVEPVEPVNWGQVDVKGYQTNVAGQGQASINNVDVITWDNAVDTVGNDITSGNVRIRLIPGEYKGETKNSLISKLYTDFILDIVHATDGNVFPVTDGSASFKWSDVISTLNLPFISIYSLINENDAWLKRGWIYEIRLEIDDYIGEWQPIYASTSSGVENDLQIVNTTVITQETINAIQSINSINSTTNIWIINGQPVDPNPEQKPPENENEKPWWVYLLEMINNTLGIQNEYINEGTGESQEVVNNFEGDHTELNNTVNDYHDIENNLVLDMNNNLEQIEVDSDLIQNNSFISSARWVAEQYTRITTDNPIGSILKFSLVLGFVMIFLGRFRT